MFRSRSNFFAEEPIFPQCKFGTFVKTQVAVAACIHFLILYSVPLLDLFIFELYYNAFVAVFLSYILRSGIKILSEFLFLLRFLGISRVFMSFIIYFSSMKNLGGEAPESIHCF